MCEMWAEPCEAGEPCELAAHCSHELLAMLVSAGSHWAGGEGGKENCCLNLFILGEFLHKLPCVGKYAPWCLLEGNIRRP